MGVEVTLRFYAECLDRECATGGTLVMTFNDADTREAWARRHRHKFPGHHVFCYIRRFEMEGDDVGQG